MATIKRFQDIEAWQKARELVKNVYSCSNDGPFARDFALRDQIRRAAISIVSNIAEGFEREGTKDFIHFLSIAKSSAAEVEAQLYVALDQGYLPEESFEEVVQQVETVKKLLGGSIRYLKSTDIRGGKFK
jgi:four helix bundle protein